MSRKPGSHKLQSIWVSHKQRNILHQVYSGSTNCLHPLSNEREFIQCPNHNHSSPILDFSLKKSPKVTHQRIVKRISFERNSGSFERL
ncbi:hypothetical protein GIB67_014496 [Kingdonia uniflora]|uniref:Uncharacterized protein n=1 Tax=Kingdonia uniflora TaxID=39325 RepID=A0A7J7LZ36_9MAGN|nr:hypothetical protein GIB67_014496 [Kingdonia uniflora]